jgi:predicted HTH domain antitoxin
MHSIVESGVMKEVQVKVPESMSERDAKVATAVEAFTRGLVSIGKASEIAEMPIQEFLVELRKRGIVAYPYSDEDALKELNL